MNLALGTQSIKLFDGFEFLDIGKKGEEGRFIQYLCTTFRRKFSLLLKRFAFIVENPFLLNSTPDSSLHFRCSAAFSMCMA